MSKGASIILEGEIKNFKNDAPQANKWSLKQKCFYLGIHVRSPKCYRYIRSQVTAPSEKTVKNVLSLIKLQPGISPFLLNVLKKKTEKYEDKDKLAVLCFDEVFLNMGLYYNPKTGLVEGYEDYGKNGRTDRESNHALVFMVRGLNAEWKLPIAFYFVDGTCPSAMLTQLIPQVIRELKKIGISVVASVCDQGPTNRKAISDLRSNCDEGQHDPIYKVDDDKIVHLFDTPHLFKNIRNHLLQSDLEFSPGKRLQWHYLVEFFKLDEGLSKISKLQYVHLCPLGRNRMRVDLAAQALGETTAAGMKTFNLLSGGRKLTGCEDTVEGIKKLDKLFDSTNGPSRKDQPKEFRTNVSRDTYHYDYWHQMIGEMESWVFINRFDNSHYVPPCLKGYIDNLRGLRWLWKLAERKGITTLKLRNLNQDPLENYFGQIRQTLGSNTDPTIPQFIAGMKTCLVQHVTSGRNGNCQEDDADFIADLEALIKEAQANTKQGEAEEENRLIRGARPDENAATTVFNKLLRQAPSLTCSTMCSKILTATKSASERCANCCKDLTASEDSSDFLFQSLKSDTAQLDRPSPHLTNYYISCQKRIEEKWKEICWHRNIRAEVTEIVSDLDTSWVTCPQHSHLVVKVLRELISVRMIHLKCAKFNNERKNRRSKPSRQVQRSLKTINIDKDMGIEDIHPHDWQRLTGLKGK